jgi:hypothetical protein
MAKKFMFVCFGILALTVAFLLGAQYGRAEYVDHSGRVVAYLGGYSGYWQILLDNGEMWGYERHSGAWTPVSGGVFTCPVPISQIKFVMGEEAAISLSDDLWYYDSGSQSWHNAGFPPGGVATQPSTWGQIKAQFKD